MQAESPAPTHPAGHKEALCFPNAGPTHSCTPYPTHTYIERGFDSGRKRLPWYTGQACLASVWSVLLPTKRKHNKGGPHCLCLHALWRSLKMAAFQYKPTIISRMDSSVLNISYCGTVLSLQIDLISIELYVFVLPLATFYRCVSPSRPDPNQGDRLPDWFCPDSSPPFWDHSACRGPSWCPALLEHLLLTHHPPLPVPQWPRYWRRSRRRVTEPEQQLWAPAGGL